MASINAIVAAVTPLVETGEMAPNVIVSAGVDPPDDDPDTPFAVTMETAVIPPPLKAAILPFSLLIAVRIVSVADTVPAPETNPVINFPVTVAAEMAVALWVPVTSPTSDPVKETAVPVVFWFQVGTVPESNAYGMDPAIRAPIVVRLDKVVMELFEEAVILLAVPVVD